jgi:carboxymethylenebutenolidase
MSELSGQMVNYPTVGGSADAYLATPDQPGPGIIVIQEWWGLVDHIKRVCDRYAAAGFVALAPDLFHGEQTTAPDEAGRMMMEMNVEQAAEEMAGGIDFLLGHDGVTSSTVGVIGFCLGGGLAYVLASIRPDQVSAMAPFYGVIPWPDKQPDYSAITAKVQGHYAERDDMATVDQVRELEATLTAGGTDVEMFIYDDCDHGFFNDTRDDVHRPDESAVAFDRVTAFLHSNVA